MKDTIVESADRCDNRYPSEDERRRILQYATTVPQRLAVLASLEEHEKAICKAAMSRMREKHGELAAEHDDQWAKTFRDHQMTLRALGQSYLLGSVAHFEERLLYWFRTIMASFGYTGEQMSFAFQVLADGAKAEMGAEHYAELQPWFDRTVEVMGEIQQPVVATD